MTATHMIKTVVETHAPATFNGEPVIAQAPAVLAACERVLGKGRSVLASPEAGYSRVKQAPVVTWFTSTPASLSPIDTLPDNDRVAAEDFLREALTKLADEATPQERALLSAALNVPDRESILSDGQAVAVINWGTSASPAGTEGFLSAGEALHSYLPDGFKIDPQAVGSSDTIAGAADPGPVGNAAAAAPIAAATTGSLGGPAAPSDGSSGVPSAERGRGLWAPLIWVGAAAALAAAFLLYALIPGNLVYAPEPEFIADPEPERRDEMEKAALRQEILLLREQLSGNVCEGSGAIAPLTAPPLPLNSTPPADAPNASPGSATEGAPPSRNDAPDDDDTVLPLGGRASVPDWAFPLGRRADAPHLVEQLKRGTVLVAGATADGVSTGTGVVVAPGVVLTNAHVVANVVTGSVFLSNESMSQGIRARVVGFALDTDSGVDFALLKADPRAGLTPLPLASAVGRFDRVVAAGYPTLIVKTDPSFADAVETGTIERIGGIALVPTAGEVSAIRSQNGQTVILHTASTSPGSSGGPLADQCGRVVGINTAVWAEDARSYVNASQASADAVAFLQENGVDVALSHAPCHGTSRPIRRTSLDRPVSSGVLNGLAGR